MELTFGFFVCNEATCHAFIEAWFLQLFCLWIIAQVSLLKWESKLKMTANTWSSLLFFCFFFYPLEDSPFHSLNSHPCLPKFESETPYWKSQAFTAGASPWGYKWSGSVCITKWDCCWKLYLWCTSCNHHLVICSAIFPTFCWHEKYFCLQHCRWRP